MPPHILTFKAEEAASLPAQDAIAFCLPLLAHFDAVVREGAIYGLAPHLHVSPAAVEALRHSATTDPSPGVRAAARDALEILC